jgi:hypothetical protein
MVERARVNRAFLDDFSSEISCNSREYGGERRSKQ